MFDALGILVRGSCCGRYYLILITNLKLFYLVLLRMYNIYVYVYILYVNLDQNVELKVLAHH